MKSFYIRDILQLEPEISQERTDVMKGNDEGRKENKEAITDSKASDRAAESVQSDRQAAENKSVAWRKKFSTKQRKQLEDSFKEQKYLSVKQRDILANDIKLSSEQVKTWYQNRRTRWRKNQIAKLRDSFWRAYPSWEYIQTETRGDEV